MGKWQEFRLRIREIRYSQLRVNVLCLGGALLGVFSLVFPWIVQQSYYWSRYFNAFEILNVIGNNGFVGFDFAMIAFIIGTILSLLTAIGITLEFIGIICFLTELSRYSEYSPGIGFWFACVSVVIIFFGALYPLGLR